MERLTSIRANFNNSFGHTSKRQWLLTQSACVYVTLGASGKRFATTTAVAAADHLDSVPLSCSRCHLVRLWRPVVTTWIQYGAYEVDTFNGFHIPNDLTRLSPSFCSIITKSCYLTKPTKWALTILRHGLFLVMSDIDNRLSCKTDFRSRNSQRQRPTPKPVSHYFQRRDHVAIMTRRNSY